MRKVDDMEMNWPNGMCYNSGSDLVSQLLVWRYVFRLSGTRSFFKVIVSR